MLAQDTTKNVGDVFFRDREYIINAFPIVNKILLIALISERSFQK